MEKLAQYNLKLMKPAKNTTNLCRYFYKITYGHYVEGFKRLIKENLIYRLRILLYELKQSFRQWYE